MTTAKTHRYTCDNCDRTEDRQTIPTGAGTNDDSARTAGWRIGATQKKPRYVLCPECVGTDEEYWDRQTLAVAYMAGIDAGNRAWGGF